MTRVLLWFASGAVLFASEPAVGQACYNMHDAMLESLISSPHSPIYSTVVT